MGEANRADSALGRALIVDDDGAIADLIKMYLQHAGFTLIDMASEGSAAWQYLLQQSYHLVVLDWRLPGLSGMALFNRLRSLPKHAGTGVLVSSALLTTEDFRLLDEYPCTQWLAKPYGESRFAASLKSLTADCAWHRSHEANVRASLELLQTDRAGALRELQALLKTHGKPVPTMLMAARIWGEGGAQGISESLVRASLKVEPQSVPALFELGKVCVRAGRLDEAMEVLAKAQALSPKNMNRARLIAEVALNKGDTDSATAYFQQAIGIDGQDVRSLSGLELAQLLDEQTGTAEGGQVSRSLASMINIAAIAHVREGRYGEGIARYGEALTFVFDAMQRARLCFNVGLAYVRWGRDAEAQSWFEKAYDLSGGKLEKARRRFAGGAADAGESALLIEMVDEVEELQPCGPAKSEGRPELADILIMDVSGEDTEVPSVPAPAAKPSPAARVQVAVNELPDEPSDDIFSAFERAHPAASSAELMRPAPPLAEPVAPAAGLGSASERMSEIAAALATSAPEAVEPRAAMSISEPALPPPPEQETLRIPSGEVIPERTIIKIKKAVGLDAARTDGMQSGDIVAQTRFVLFHTDTDGWSRAERQLKQLGALDMVGTGDTQVALDALRQGPSAFLLLWHPGGGDPRALQLLEATLDAHFPRRVGILVHASGESAVLDARTRGTHLMYDKIAIVNWNRARFDEDMRMVLAAMQDEQAPLSRLYSLRLASRRRGDEGVASAADIEKMRQGLGLVLPHPAAALWVQAAHVEWLVSSSQAQAARAAAAQALQQWPKAFASHYAAAVVGAYAGDAAAVIGALKWLLDSPHALPERIASLLELLFRSRCYGGVREALNIAAGYGDFATDYRYFYYAGRLLLLEHRSDEALLCLEAAIERCADRWDLLLVYAEALFAGNDFNSANLVAEQCLRLVHADLISARILKIRSLGRLRQWKEADSAVQKLLEAAPKLAAAVALQAAVQKRDPEL